MRRDLDPLGLSTRQRRGRLTKPQVAEANLVEDLQTPQHLWRAAKECERLSHREVEHLMDRSPAVSHFEQATSLVTEDMVRSMRPGSVIIDISIDQGGTVETSRMTTHSDPTYVEHGVVHYAVGNMPGAVPNTSTYALTNVTLPYAVALANLGWRDALRADPALALGLNTYAGELTSEPVAAAHGYSARPLADVL